MTESRGWSGGTVQLWRLCEALQRRGHAVALVCPPGGEILKHAAGGGMDVALCPMRQDYDLFAAARLAGAVRRFRPDVVHAHHPRAHALCLLAGVFSPMPRLVVSRRVSFRLNRWNVFSQWKYRSRRISAYAAVSEDIRRVLTDGGVPPERVEVIHSGVDVEKFSPRTPDENLRRELGLPAGVPIVGNVTHFSWWKGQRVFLQAAKRVAEGGAAVHFLLAGKDTDGAEAAGLARSLGLEGRVTLAGFRTDMPELLSLLSASVVSSLAGEGFSGVLRESMAMGVPVAATDVGGNRELVVHEKTGLLVPPGDAEALARAILRLVADAPLARAMADAARENVRSRYSIETMVEKNIRLYEKLLAA
ncbi:MAG: glycosyltransferase [Elusimicrobiota bacterium]